MKNHLKYFNYSRGKNVPQLNYQMFEEDSKLFLYLIKNKKYTTILASYCFNFSHFLDKIFKSKKNKLTFILEFALERRQLEAVKELLLQGAELPDDSLSLMAVHNFNEDKEILEFVVGNENLSRVFNILYENGRLTETDFLKTYIIRSKVKNF